MSENMTRPTDWLAFTIPRSVVATRAYDTTVEDLWEADLCAIGVAAPSEPGRLVYISTFSKPPGQYDVTLELPPQLSDELPYESASEWLELDFEGLATIVAKHLGIRRIDQHPDERSS